MDPPGEGSRRIVDETAAQVRACTRCRLHESRSHAVPGEGPAVASVFLIGEAPGRDEDASGLPFIGAAGRVLDRALKAAKLPRDRVFLTNVVKCRPPSNRAPKADEIESCHPYLMTQIAAVRPKVIVTLGSTALRAVAGPDVNLKDARGKPMPYQGALLVPTYHPAAALYNRSLESSLAADLKVAARQVRAKRKRIRSAPPRTDRPTMPTSSSGAVIVNPEGRILLLRRADENTWGLPKGTVEEGESLEETAVREVREESGLRVRLHRPLMRIRYALYWPPDDVNYDKTVAYFLAEPVGGRIRLEPGFEEARWVTRDEARRLLHWPNDRDVVAKAFEVLAQSARRETRGPGRGAKRSGRRPS